MTGLEVVVGYLIAWGVRKARRVGSAADTEVDRVLDAGLERLHGAVSEALGDDPALTALVTESTGGEVTGRTAQRVQLSLEAATEAHPELEPALAEIVDEVRAVEKQAGVQLVSAGERGLAVGGDLTIRADRGSLATGTAGDITFGGAPPDPRRPGSASG